VASRLAASDAVWQVCQALPRQQRAAVVLRFYEDLDYAEIAAVLDLAEPTVRSHVHRALAALRVELSAQEDER
jgi:RNA polymerase sigma factor (sigma-70 family)